MGFNALLFNRIHCETYQDKIASFGGVKKKYMDGEELGTVKVESFIIIRP